MHWRLSIRLFALAALLAQALPAAAHDHTALKAQRDRAAALVAAAKLAQPAPQAGDGQKACQLTIELTLDDAPQPVAGLVRVTNVAAGKAISFPDEIHRELNWYALAPRTTLALPQAKLKLEALHGIESTLATHEIDLTGKDATTLKVPLKRLYDAASAGWSRGTRTCT